MLLSGREFIYGFKYGDVCVIHMQVFFADSIDAVFL